MGRGDKRLHRRETEQINKILKILRIGALRRPGKSVVAADKYANASTMHLTAGFDGVLEFALDRMVSGVPGLMPYSPALRAVFMSQASPGATKCLSLAASSMSSASSSAKEA